eukprot:GSChrysophyteH1.ASY1.ANO1.2494.1 assembled CDS
MVEWTREMMDAEVIECSRYGDVEDLRALLVDGADVNSQDESGTTGLHKAAANGEVAAMTILKEFGALHQSNSGGNYPIHWAAQNGQVEAFKFLLENYEVDVLLKNGQGRSTLTEAFTNGNETILEVCLSHPSASEEKLIQTAESGGSVTLPEESSRETESEGNEAGRSELSQYDEVHAVTHSMILRRDAQDKRSLLVREMPITRADNPFGSDTSPEDDTTGLGLWPSSVLCARWMAQDSVKDLMRGKCIVELGAGCGLPGIAAAYYGSPATVYITDIHEPALRNSLHNIKEANRGQCILTGVEQPTAVHVRKVSWTDKESFPPEMADVLVGSDLVYDVDILAVLCPAVNAMLKNGGSFLYVAPDDARDGMPAFVQAMKSLGLHCTKIEKCSDDLYENPLSHPSKDDYVLHFYDLGRKLAHTMYTFVKTLPTSEGEKRL